MEERGGQVAGRDGGIVEVRGVGARNHGGGRRRCVEIGDGGRS